MACFPPPQVSPTSVVPCALLSTLLGCHRPWELHREADWGRASAPSQTWLSLGPLYSTETSFAIPEVGTIPEWPHFIVAIPQIASAIWMVPCGFCIGRPHGRSTVPSRRSMEKVTNWNYEDGEEIVGPSSVGSRPKTWENQQGGRREHSFFFTWLQGGALQRT